jgi:hypothetical protein
MRINIIGHYKFSKNINKIHCSLNMKTTIILLSFIVLAVVPAEAQLISTLNIEFKNPARMSMEIDRPMVALELPLNWSGGALPLGNPVTVKIKSNVSWILTATINTDFICIDKPSLQISASQLEFKSRLIGSTENIFDQQEDFIGFVKNQAMVVARGSATPDEGLNIINEFRIKISLKDPAGKFSLPIMFSLSPS